MAGLYAGLILKLMGFDIRIFELNDRVGGRVYTHRFTQDPNQYFEAGAMRLPRIPEQQLVFELIELVNSMVPPALQVNLIPYVLYDAAGNNLVYMNGTRQPNGQTMTMSYADANPGALGFPLPASDQGKTASSLLDAELGPFLQALDKNFLDGFAQLLAYDNYSLYTYLTAFGGWTDELVNYTEAMTSQTNQFHNSLPELVIENMDFSTAGWFTIANGMDRLPQACASIIGMENITLGARVQALEQLADGRVAVHWDGASTPDVFDKVIAAVPPAVLRMWQTPQWSADKTHAIRAMHYEPLYKIGMRFKTRFWEQVPAPSHGGQSITDLPSRWFVYPSYGIGDSGPGVMLLYSWMTDGAAFLPQPESERVRIALRDLQAVYGPAGVDVAGQFIESFDVAWPTMWATGDAMFFPGQFASLFNIARAPEGNIYFAGEHLSVNHTWIVGALDSALLAVQQLLGSGQVEPPRPKGAGRRVPHRFDYSPLHSVKPTPGPARRPQPGPRSRNGGVRWRFESL